MSMIDKRFIKQIIISITRSNLIKLRKISPYELNYDIFNDDKFIEKLGIDSLELITIATEVNIFFNLHKVGIEDYLLVKKTLDDWAELANKSLEYNNGLLTFSTSGSTGKPKRVDHHLDILLNEAKELNSILSPFNRIISLVPSHHIYGFLYTILLPQISKSEIIYETNLKINKLQDHDLIVAIPQQWFAYKNILSDNSLKLKGTSSTARLNEDIFQDIVNSNIDLYEFYGSTETLGIAYRNKPYDNFTPFSYITIKEKQFYNTFTSKPLELMDEIEIVDNKIKILRRKDNAVSIGGINVFPNLIEQKIKSHNLVQDCIVRPYETPNGTRLKAFIIPIELTENISNQIANYIKTFPTPEKITNITFGEKLPINELGKLTDW